MKNKNKKTNRILDQVKKPKKIETDQDDKSQGDSSTDSKPNLFKRIKSRWPWRRKPTLIGLSVILIPLILLSVLGAYTYTKAKTLQGLVAATEISGRETYHALRSQDLILANQKLHETQDYLDQVSHVYSQLGIYAYTPFRSYYLDGQAALAAAESGLKAGEVLFDTLEPYADVLGFSGAGSFEGGTAEDRIVAILETMSMVVPALDQVAEHLVQVQNHLDRISPDRYPFEVRGQNVGELIEQAKAWSSTAVVGVTEVKPILEVIPRVAGLEEEKKYLVLFQNDAEIRPTGGFMTAYGILRVDNGRVSQDVSDDIYALDARFNSRIPAPAPIRRYLDNINYWHLRDMNLSPDFKESMDTFMTHYRQIPGEPADELDGIIAVDTQVLVDLIRVLGPTEVPGYGIYTAEIDPRCDCPQVIYELEDYATRPRAYLRDDRKSFLGPMLQTILLKAYGAPSESWPELFDIMINNVMEKHVLFYMFDEEVQLAAESVNIAGRIQDFDGDYLHINDSNLGGAKSNLFITESVDMIITAEESGVTNLVEVTYRNPAPASNCNLEAGQLCLNAVYRGWVRFYLPLGSELIQTQGLEEGTVEVSEDLGKTVVEGFFRFAPQSQARVRVEYQSAYIPGEDYKLLIQKQPGKKNPEYTVTFNQVEQKEFDLRMDREVVFER